MPCLNTIAVSECSALAHRVGRPLGRKADGTGDSKDSARLIRNYQGPPGGRRGQYAGVANQMKPRWRHKRGKFAEEFQGLKDDVGGSVAPAAFEVIEEPAVGQKRQALGCDRRATCVTRKPFETAGPPRSAPRRWTVFRTDSSNAWNLRRRNPRPRQKANPAGAATDLPPHPETEGRQRPERAGPDHRSVPGLTSLSSAMRRRR